MTTTSCPQCSCVPKRVKLETPSRVAEESVSLIPEPPNLVPIVAKEN